MARYAYSCMKCGGTVTKQACGTQKKGAYTGLHGWSCNECGSGVKVSRKLK